MSAACTTIARQQGQMRMTASRPEKLLGKGPRCRRSAGNTSSLADAIVMTKTCCQITAPEPLQLLKNQPIGVVDIQTTRINKAPTPVTHPTGISNPHRPSVANHPA